MTDPIKVNQSELLPCPFCGSAAALTPMKPFDNIELWGAICTRCYVNTHHFARKAHAIAAWNTRAEVGCVPEGEAGVVIDLDAGFWKMLREAAAKGWPIDAVLAGVDIGAQP